MIQYTIPLSPLIHTVLAPLLAIILLVVVLIWLRRENHPQSQPRPGNAIVTELTSESITQRFLASIPQITRALNLELCSATQTEVFQATESMTLFSGVLNLGTNTAEISVPVTFRYHLRLSDKWRLDLRGNSLIVHAPAISPSLPPAIHTDRMEKRAERGWARLPPSDLLEKLEREMTPVLSRYAMDAKHLELIRPQCRHAVAEFIHQCLQHEVWWKRGTVQALQIHFVDEPAVSSPATLKLQTEI